MLILELELPPLQSLMPMQPQRQRLSSGESASQMSKERPVVLKVTHQLCSAFVGNIKNPWLRVLN